MKADAAEPETSPHAASAAGSGGGRVGKPRLLMVGGAFVNASAVARELIEHFDVKVTSAEGALDSLRSEDYHAVLAGTADFLPIERELIAQRSSVLLNAVGEGICLSDGEGRIIWSNRTFTLLDERLQKRIGLVCRRALLEYARTVADDEPLRARLARITLRKSRQQFEVMVSPAMFVEPGKGAQAPAPGEIKAAEGAALASLRAGRGHVAAAVRDVTPAYRTRLKIDAIERAGRELVQFDEDAVMKMHAAERLAMLEQRVIRTAHDLLNFDHFLIRLLNRKSGELELVMSAGLPEEARQVRLFARSEGQGISGHVAATGRAYICDDARRDPRYVMGLESPGSSLTVPLRMFDRVVGVFNVESNQTGAFDKHDLQFAEIFAQHVAMSFHILKLLLVERYTTTETAQSRVQGELSGPLNDLATTVSNLRDHADTPEEKSLLARIEKDLASIRAKVKKVSQSPTGVLGADDVLARQRTDPALEGRRVLVADNDPEVLNTVRDILGSLGAVVVTCDNGESAVKTLGMWELMSDPTEAFHLVVSDINLGDMTGYDVFAAAKTGNPKLPVILMTGFGYDPHHSIVRASQEGLQSVLFKPFQAEKLIEDVKKGLAGS